MTGSTDGTARIWNMEMEKLKKGDSQNSQKSFTLNDERLKVTIDEKRKNPQCDCLTWSAFGRYAIVSISCREEGQGTKDISIIKVWDSYTNTLIHDLAKTNNLTLYTYSFVTTLAGVLMFTIVSKFPE